MANVSADVGVLTELIERLEKHRLPLLLSLKERVDSGHVLDDRELAGMEEAIKDAQRAFPLIQRNPGYLKIASGVVSLYEEISAQALKNEKS